MKSLKNILIVGLCICFASVLTGVYVYDLYVLADPLTANELALLQMSNRPDSSLRYQQYVNAVNFTSVAPVILLVIWVAIIALIIYFNLKQKHDETK